MKIKPICGCKKNSFFLQAKEIQALQTRMQASHDSHALEVQTLQAQMHQLQDVVASSSMGNLQRLQEVNSYMFVFTEIYMHP